MHISALKVIYKNKYTTLFAVKKLAFAQIMFRSELEYEMMLDRFINIHFIIVIYLLKLW